jgi:hypothetical protein
MSENTSLQQYPLLQDVIGIAQILSMFDLLTDVIFWIKNTESRVIYANKGFVKYIGMHSLNQVLGKQGGLYFD